MGRKTAFALGFGLMMCVLWLVFVAPYTVPSFVQSFVHP